jgi:aryl-phospho-beta-D-glucosidase BglC (GH1 family)
MVETPIVLQNFSQYNSTGPINTNLAGLNSLQILDKIIAYAGQEGLKVILDNHRSEAGETAEANGLWYTSTYTSQDWVNDWVTLAKRYAGNPTVVGFDLRNEPHTPAGDTYAQGATWGTGVAATDIRLAYEQAGNAILAVDPNALVFCEGIGETPNASGGLDSTWWGGDLELAGQFPVTLSSPGHVVYSAHDYGPDLFQQTWFNSSTTSASLDAVWNKYWGYLGGSKWSSQRLGSEELRCESKSGVGWMQRAGSGCGRQVARPRRDGRSGSGSGRRSRAGCRARTPRWWLASRRRWARGGSVKLVACRRSFKAPCRGATCP